MHPPTFPSARACPFRPRVLFPLLYLSLPFLPLACSSSSGSSANPDGGGPGDSGMGAEGGMPEGGRDVGPPVEGGPGISAIKTIFIIVMENHNWSDILGSSSAPYINGTLLPMASYCDNYFDNPKMVHPSEPNYIWLEAGDNLGITSDADPSTNFQTTTDHLVTQLKTAGVSWHAYEEDMPIGTCPVTSVGNYAAKHNPMVFFTDVSGNPPSSTATECIAHEFPYTQLAMDLGAGAVAQYNFLTPNLCNDMHNACAPLNDEIKQGDMWLSTEVPKILASQAYKNGGALFITWDESEITESPIGMIVLSPLAKGGGYVSHLKYYHSSTLRSVEEVFGVPLLRDAANQYNLSDLFTTYP